MIILEMLESMFRGYTRSTKEDDKNWEENLIEDLRKFKAIMKKGDKDGRN